jgi:hypothetical protein
MSSSPAIALDIELAKKLLTTELPPTWQLTIVDRKICVVTQTFISIESEVKPMIGRVLLAYVLFKENEIVVISPKLFSREIEKVVKALEPYKQYCLIVTDCPKHCETCINQWIGKP